MIRPYATTHLVLRIWDVVNEEVSRWWDIVARCGDPRLVEHAIAAPTGETVIEWRLFEGDCPDLIRAIDKSKAENVVGLIEPLSLGELQLPVRSLVTWTEQRYLVPACQWSDCPEDCAAIGIVRGSDDMAWVCEAHQFEVAAELAEEGGCAAFHPASTAELLAAGARGVVVEPVGYGRVQSWADSTSVESAADVRLAEWLSRNPGKVPTHVEAFVEGVRWSQEMSGEPHEDLAAIRRIIERVEDRALAVDGPVTPTRLIMTDEELRSIYRLAGGTTS